MSDDQSQRGESPLRQVALRDGMSSALYRVYLHGAGHITNMLR